MLQLTTEAATLLSDVCRQQGLSPESSGVRVSGNVDQAGQLIVQMNLQEDPEPADEVSEQEGINLFVAPEVAEPLSNALVDVAQTPDGPQLALHRQDDAT